jgi:hypothetical protein
MVVLNSHNSHKCSRVSQSAPHSHSHPENTHNGERVRYFALLAAMGLGKTRCVASRPLCLSVIVSRCETLDMRNFAFERYPPRVRARAPAETFFMNASSGTQKKPPWLRRMQKVEPRPPHLFAFSVRVCACQVFCPYHFSSSARRVRRCQFFRPR